MTSSKPRPTSAALAYPSPFFVCCMSPGAVIVAHPLFFLGYPNVCVLPLMGWLARDLCASSSCWFYARKNKHNETWRSQRWNSLLEPLARDGKSAPIPGAGFGGGPRLEP